LPPIFYLSFACQRLRNDLKCVEWDVKPYYTHTPSVPRHALTFADKLVVPLFNVARHCTRKSLRNVIFVS